MVRLLKGAVALIYLEKWALFEDGSKEESVDEEEMPIGEP
ncbi:hypothetical protein JCM19233_1959 [Vibrio astriarenae]|nr:hypothetical protein JCM19233_1959 [Vibrio sp. C7]